MFSPGKITRLDPQSGLGLHLRGQLLPTTSRCSPPHKEPGNMLCKELSSFSCLPSLPLSRVHDGDRKIIQSWYRDSDFSLHSGNDHGDSKFTVRVWGWRPTYVGQSTQVS